MLSNGISKLSGMIEASLKANSSVVYSNYFQLATVDKENNPQVRTISFRGFYNNDTIKATTEIKTSIVSDVTKNQICQICWYFPISREQYRISCKAKLVTSTNIEKDLLIERENAWNKLSDERKKDFEDKCETKNEDKTSENKSNIPENYVLLLLVPLNGDYYLDKNPFTQFKF